VSEQRSRSLPSSTSPDALRQLYDEIPNYDPAQEAVVDQVLTEKSDEELGSEVDIGKVLEKPRRRLEVEKQYEAFRRAGSTPAA
jgi:hypothetical protein